MAVVYHNVKFFYGVKTMAMKIELIDELLKGCITQEDVFGDEGVFKQLVKAISERALQAELTTHLGYEKHEIKDKNSGNSHNGASAKAVGHLHHECDRINEYDFTKGHEKQMRISFG
jgi:hypothetical protein